MAQSTCVQVIGAVTAQPSAASLYSCSMQELLSLTVFATYTAAKGGVISVASSDPSPFTLPIEGIVKVRFFAIRLLSGATMKLKVTTGLGVAVYPVSDLNLIHNPNPGDEITAIQLVGTGDVAYAMAGDVL